MPHQYESNASVAALRRLQNYEDFPGHELMSEFEFSQPTLGGLAREDSMVDISPGQFLRSGERVGPQTGYVERDPSLNSYVLNKAMESEVKDRLFRAARSQGLEKRYPTPEGQSPVMNTEDVGALSVLLGNVQDDINENPITRQQGLYNLQEEANQAALREGFRPQNQYGASASGAKAQYGREQERYKVEGPERVARATAGGNLAQQQESSRGALEVEKARQAGALDVAKQQAQQYKEVLDMMQGQGGTPGMPGGIRGLTLPTKGGGGSVSFQGPSSASQVPPALLTDLTNKRYAAEKAGVETMFGNPTPAGQALEQAALGVLARYPADSDIKELTRVIMSDPQYRNLTTEQILQKMHGTVLNAESITPAERAQLDVLLSLLRGNY